MVLLITVTLYNCDNNETKEDDENSDKNDIPSDAVNTELGEAIGRPSLREMIEGLPSGQKQYLSNKLHQYSEAPVLDIQPGGGFSKGNINSQYHIIEFSDFNCLHCMILNQILNYVLEKAPDSIYLESRVYPLDIACNRLVPEDFAGNGDGSCKMAKAAICAGEQGKHFEFKEYLYKYITQPVDNRINKAIDKTEIDKEKFDECMITEKVEEKLSIDVNKGISLDITSTPYLIWNGKRLDNNRMVILAMLLSYSNPNHPLFKELLPKPKIDDNK
jgi:protein-disulfide isomerase